MGILFENMVDRSWTTVKGPMGRHNGKGTLTLVRPEMSF